MEKSTKITLYSASILMFIVYVLSVIRGGFANTGSGFPVPDTGLTIPFIFYIAFVALEVVLINRHKSRLMMALVLLAKVLFYGYVLLVSCGYAVTRSYMSCNRTGSFHDNFWYGVMVISYIVIPSIAAISQAIFLFKKQ